MTQSGHKLADVTRVELPCYVLNCDHISFSTLRQSHISQRRLPLLNIILHGVLAENKVVEQMEMKI